MRIDDARGTADGGERGIEGYRQGRQELKDRLEDAAAGTRCNQGLRVCCRFGSSKQWKQSNQAAGEAKVDDRADGKHLTVQSR